MCALDGYLYAFGGWVGEDIGGTIERYNPTKDQWEYLTKMQEPRFSMGICVYDSLIYLVGGCTHSRRHMQELVSYNPVNLLFFLTIFDRDFTSWSQELFFFHYVHLLSIFHQNFYFLFSIWTYIPFFIPFSAWSFISICYLGLFFNYFPIFLFIMDYFQKSFFMNV